MRTQSNRLQPYQAEQPLQTGAYFRAEDDGYKTYFVVNKATAQQAVSSQPEQVAVSSITIDQWLADICNLLRDSRTSRAKIAQLIKNFIAIVLAACTPTTTTAEHPELLQRNNIKHHLGVFTDATYIPNDSHHEVHAGPTNFLPTFLLMLPKLSSTDYTNNIYTQVRQKITTINSHDDYATNSSLQAAAGLLNSMAKELENYIGLEDYKFSDFADLHRLLSNGANGFNYHHLQNFTITFGAYVANFVLIKNKLTGALTLITDNLEYPADDIASIVAMRLKITKQMAFHTGNKPVQLLAYKGNEMHLYKLQANLLCANDEPLTQERYTCTTLSEATHCFYDMQAGSKATKISYEGTHITLYLTATGNMAILNESSATEQQTRKRKRGAQPHTMQHLADGTLKGSWGPIETIIFNIAYVLCKSQHRQAVSKLLLNIRSKTQIRSHTQKFSNSLNRRGISFIQISALNILPRDQLEQTLQTKLETLHAILGFRFTMPNTSQVLSQAIAADAAKVAAEAAAATPAVDSAVAAPVNAAPTQTTSAATDTTPTISPTQLSQTATAAPVPATEPSAGTMPAISTTLSQTAVAAATNVIMQDQTAPPSPHTAAATADQQPPQFITQREANQLQQHINSLQQDIILLAQSQQYYVRVITQLQQTVLQLQNQLQTMQQQQMPSASNHALDRLAEIAENPTARADTPSTTELRPPPTSASTSNSAPIDGVGFIQSSPNPPPQPIIMGHTNQLLTEYPT